MPISIADVPTTAPASPAAMQALRAQAGRAPAPKHGRIAFPFGVCERDAGVDVLKLRVEAADATLLAQTENVVARHLVRFAFREPLEVVWVAA
jgi:hypothetical protein